MTPAHGLLAIFAALALSADRSSASKLSGGGSDTSPSFPRVTASVPGYRRAKQPEITPPMYEEAVRAVQPGAAQLGDVRYFDFNSDTGKFSFAVAMETHYNETKGYHKGASVFVPA